MFWILFNFIIQNFVLCDGTLEPNEENKHADPDADAETVPNAEENIEPVKNGLLSKAPDTVTEDSINPETEKTSDSESTWDWDESSQLEQVFQEFSQAITNEIHETSIEAKPRSEPIESETAIEPPESKTIKEAIQSEMTSELITETTSASTEEEDIKALAELQKKREAEEKQKEKDEREKLVPYVEASLFLAGRPISELEIAEHLNSDRLTVRWALRRIKRNLQEQNSAMEVLNPTKDRWVLQLCEEFSRGLYDHIQEFIPKEAMLSSEEIETLTAIAYRQPITSALLVKISGRPTIYESIRSLHEKGFITLEKQERTNLLKTSKKFADIYGFDTEMRNLKIQLVWRLKKRAKLEKV